MKAESVLLPIFTVAAAASAYALSTVVESRTDRLVSKRDLAKRSACPEDNYNLTIFHINDVHAHLDQFVKAGTDCVDPTKGCFGGYARVKDMVDHLRPEQTNSLFLDAGDEFQGTLFFSYYGGEKIAETINQLGFDAFVPGNHEFDRGDAFLAEFLANISSIPAVCANVNSANAALNAALVPYHIFPEHNLAVIGVTIDTIAQISNPDEGTTFGDPVEAVQRVVDGIYATTDVKRVVVVTHIGYEADMDLAERTRGVYMIVGGHSHTLLGDIAGASGPYPTIKTNLDGEEVFIVTSYRWGEYVGLIDIVFDADGKVISYTGAPIHLDNTTAQDPALQASITEWEEPFAAFAAQVVAFSAGDLDQTACQTAECTLGDLMADAAYAYRVNMSAGSVAGALINAGGIRASVDAGNVTVGQVLTSFPFGNSVTDVRFSGADWWKVFEGLASRVSQFNGQALAGFAQVSAQIRFVYDPDNAVGSRLVSLRIGDAEVTSGDETVYALATWDFVATGGDNIMPAQTLGAILDTQEDVLINYLESVGTVNVTLDGRISTTT